MRFELLPLLDAASGASRRPLIASSVRDVLGGGQKDPARQDEMLEKFEKYFDRLLVHGDPALIPFGRTFRHAARLGDKLHYTGYVVDGETAIASANESNDMPGAGEVLVSAGGGAVGRKLLETAIRARPLTRLADRTWRVLCGVNAAAAEVEALSALASSIGEGRVIVECARTDFARMLGRCELSVSQGGYNTVMEMLQARTRAVVVPFAGGAETEQTLRTGLLAKLGLIDMVEETGLEPRTLAGVVNRAADRPRRSGAGIDLHGAQTSADWILQWASEKQW
jgi:predicted glycosyltransferase